MNSIRKEGSILRNSRKFIFAWHDIFAANFFLLAMKFFLRDWEISCELEKGTLALIFTYTENELIRDMS